MWAIAPGTSVGPLFLGMPEQDFVALLGPVGGVFRRTPESNEEVIAYDDAAVHLTVDATRHVRGISVFQPRQVSLAGVQLLGRGIADVARDTSTTPYHFEKVEAGFWCATANILLVEVDGVVDGVEVGPVARGPDRLV